MTRFFLRIRGWRRKSLDPARWWSAAPRPSEWRRSRLASAETLQRRSTEQRRTWSAHRGLVHVLEEKAGRLIFNGFPTGVEVVPAMHHGGPFPATTDPKFTSVGTAAIYRFARSVCYQSFPQWALPEELQDANPRGIWRQVDGLLKREPVNVE